MRLLVKLAVLSGSGLAASLGISLLLSGRIEAIGQQAASLSLFLTIQVAAVTLAKLGIDQYTFAIANLRPREEVVRSRAVLASSSAICLAFGIWGCISSGAAFGVGLFASAIFDTAALIRCAQLNARGQLVRVAIANLASYPLFFVLVLAKSIWLGFTLDSAILLLTFCSVLRFAIVWSRYHARRVVHVVDLRLVFAVAAFALGNILLHRVDQLGLALEGSGRAWVGSADSLRDYLLLARFAETVSGSWPLIGVALFPFLRALFVSNRLAASVVLLITPLVVASGIGYFYFYIWTDRPGLALTQGTAFLAAGILSFFVNFLAYLMFGFNQVKALAGLALLFGAIAGAIGWPLVRDDPSRLSWLVPTCLGAFSAASCAWLCFLHFLKARSNHT